MHLQVVDKRKYATRNLSDELIDAFSTNLHRFESLVIRAFPESSGRMLSRSPHASLVQSIQQMGPLPVHLKRLCLPFYANMSNRRTTEAITGLIQNMKTNHFTHFALLDQGEQRRSIMLGAFLDFLRSCPVLESLWIEDAGPTVKKENIREVMDTVNMPNLRCVQYKDSSESLPQNSHVSSFYWLLTVIRVPENAAVYLTSPLITKALEHSPEMYQALSPFFGRLSMVQILQETDCPGLLFHDDRLYLKIPENGLFVSSTRRTVFSRRDYHL